MATAAAAAVATAAAAATAATPSASPSAPSVAAPQQSPPWSQTALGSCLAAPKIRKNKNLNIKYMCEGGGGFISIYD